MSRLLPSFDRNGYSIFSRLTNPWVLNWNVRPVNSFTTLWEQSLRIYHSSSYSRVTLHPFCNYKCLGRLRARDAVSEVTGSASAITGSSCGRSGRARLSSTHALTAGRLFSCWMHGTHVKAGLGCQRGKFMWGWGKTDNTGMCFIKFRKIYNLKGMKKKKNRPLKEQAFGIWGNPACGRPGAKLSRVLMNDYSGKMMKAIFITNRAKWGSI